MSEGNWEQSKSTEEAWRDDARIEAIFESLSSFLTCLRSTRSLEEFPSWTEENIVVVFEWADHLSTLVKGMEFGNAKFEGFEALIARIPQLGIEYLDRMANKDMILLQPSVAIICAILSSPILSWLPQNAQVVSKCLRLCEARAGIGETTKAVKMVTMDLFQRRMTRNLNMIVIAREYKA